MVFENLPILIIIVLSVIGHNNSVAIAATVLLLLKLLGLQSFFPALEDKGMFLGITILTIAMLVPLVNGKITIPQMVQAINTPVGIVSLLAGIFVAYAAGIGLPLIQTSPQVVSSLILGTIIGVCFFRGIAVGPLIAGGIVALITALLTKISS